MNRVKEKPGKVNELIVILGCFLLIDWLSSGEGDFV